MKKSGFSSHCEDHQHPMSSSSSVQPMEDDVSEDLEAFHREQRESLLNSKHMWCQLPDVAKSLFSVIVDGTDADEYQVVFDQMGVQMARCEACCRHYHDSRRRFLNGALGNARDAYTEAINRADVKRLLYHLQSLDGPYESLRGATVEPLREVHLMLCTAMPSADMDSDDSDEAQRASNEIEQRPILNAWINAFNRRFALVCGDDRLLNEWCTLPSALRMPFYVSYEAFAALERALPSDKRIGGTKGAIQDNSNEHVPFLEQCYARVEDQRGVDKADDDVLADTDVVSDDPPLRWPRIDRMTLFARLSAALTIVDDKLLQKHIVKAQRREAILDGLEAAWTSGSNAAHVRLGVLALLLRVCNLRAGANAANVFDSRAKLLKDIPAHIGSVFAQLRNVDDSLLAARLRFGETITEWAPFLCKEARRLALSKGVAKYDVVKQNEMYERVFKTLLRDSLTLAVNNAALLVNPPQQDTPKVDLAVRMIRRALAMLRDNVGREGGYAPVVYAWAAPVVALSCLSQHENKLAKQLGKEAREVVVHTLQWDVETWLQLHSSSSSSTRAVESISWGTPVPKGVHSLLEEIVEHVSSVCVTLIGRFLKAYTLVAVYDREAPPRDSAPPLEHMARRFFDAVHRLLRQFASCEKNRRANFFESDTGLELYPTLMSAPARVAKAVTACWAPWSACLPLDGAVEARIVYNATRAQLSRCIMVRAYTTLYCSNLVRLVRRFLQYEADEDAAWMGQDTKVAAARDKLLAVTVAVIDHCIAKVLKKHHSKASMVVAVAVLDSWHGLANLVELPYFETRGVVQMRTADKVEEEAIRRISALVGFYDDFVANNIEIDDEVSTRFRAIQDSILDSAEHAGVRRKRLRKKVNMIVFDDDEDDDEEEERQEGEDDEDSEVSVVDDSMDVSTASRTTAGFKRRRVESEEDGSDVVLGAPPKKRPAVETDDVIITGVDRAPPVAMAAKSRKNATKVSATSKFLLRPSGVKKISKGVVKKSGGSRRESLNLNKRKERRTAKDSYVSALTWNGVTFRGEKEVVRRKDVKPVPSAFDDIDEYIDAWEPLMIEELRSQLRNDADAISREIFDKSVGWVKLKEGRRREGTLIKISVELDKKSPLRNKLREQDLLVLCDEQASMDEGGSIDLPELHILAVVAAVERGPRGHTYKLLVAVPSHASFSRVNKMINRMSTDKSFFAIKLTDMTTFQREYVALTESDKIPLIPYILQPIDAHDGDEDEPDLPAAFGVGERRGDSMHPVVEQFNPSQRRAIGAACMKAEGFTLVQGPPGTGKTRVLLGLISAVLRPPDVPLNSDMMNPLTGLPFVKRILVCAPSNAAVDEIVARLCTDKLVSVCNGEAYAPKVVRVGHLSRVLTQNHAVALDSLMHDVKKRHGEQAWKQEIETKDKRVRELNDECRYITMTLDTLLDERKQIDAELKYALDSALVDDATVQRMREAKRETGAKAHQLKEERASKNRELDALRAELDKLYEQRNAKERAQRWRLLNDAQVVCCTLSGAASSYMSEHKFDMVIVDEAAQATEVSTLIPLQLGARRCVLVGDPNQLPPFVASRFAADLLYEQSMFSRMMTANATVHLLDTQYRMHPKISQFAREYFYQLKLRDALIVATERGKPTPLYTKPFHASPLFGAIRFYNLLDGEQSKEQLNLSSSSSSVLSSLPSTSASLSNVMEADCCVLIYRALRNFFPDVCRMSIGFITPYRRQALLLRHKLRGEPDNVHIDTVDGFQGREMDIVIMSCVRAVTPDGDESVGFLRDLRRMNVAITRAKYGLFVVGSRQALSRNEAWRNLMDHYARDDALVSLTSTEMSDIMSKSRRGTAEQALADVPAKREEAKKKLKEKQRKALANKIQQEKYVSAKDARQKADSNLDKMVSSRFGDTLPMANPYVSAQAATSTRSTPRTSSANSSWLMPSERGDADYRDRDHDRGGGRGRDRDRDRDDRDRRDHGRDRYGRDDRDHAQRSHAAYHDSRSGRGAYDRADRRDYDYRGSTPSSRQSHDTMDNRHVRGVAADMSLQHMHQQAPPPQHMIAYNAPAPRPRDPRSGGGGGGSVDPRVHPDRRAVHAPQLNAVSGVQMHVADYGNPARPPHDPRRERRSVTPPMPMSSGGGGGVGVVDPRVPPPDPRQRPLAAPAADPRIRSAPLQSQAAPNDPRQRAADPRIPPQPSASSASTLTSHAAAPAIAARDPRRTPSTEPRAPTPPQTSSASSDRRVPADPRARRDPRTQAPASTTNVARDPRARPAAAQGSAPPPPPTVADPRARLPPSSAAAAASASAAPADPRARPALTSVAPTDPRARATPSGSATATTTSTTAAPSDPRTRPSQSSDPRTRPSQSSDPRTRPSQSSDPRTRPSTSTATSSSADPRLATASRAAASASGASRDPRLASRAASDAGEAHAPTASSSVSRDPRLGDPRVRPQIRVLETIPAHFQQPHDGRRNSSRAARAASKPKSIVDKLREQHRR